MWRREELTTKGRSVWLASGCTVVTVNLPSDERPGIATLCGRQRGGLILDLQEGFVSTGLYYYGIQPAIAARAASLRAHI